MPEWTITKLRGKLALTFEYGGKRKRYSLNTSDRHEAEKIAPAIYAELTRTNNDLIDGLFSSYRKEKVGRVIANNMQWSWKALEQHFSGRYASSLVLSDSRAYIEKRRKQGKSDGTIHTELNHLRIVLNWASKHGIIEKAPFIELPKAPAPKDRYLTHEEALQLLENATMPHIKLAIHLMLATAARISALLELTWDRVDFERRRIVLCNPNDNGRRKGRAVVPVNNTLFAALYEAKQAALSDYVIEWNCKRVLSIKKGIATTAKNACVEDVSPHVFRHTAAVWMAEAGISMSEIAQYLGHSSTSITEKVYARFSPDYLRNAASALEIDLHEVGRGSMNLKRTS
ncbi:site-specific integrase [Bartonella tamiae]|uniref:Tyr recombinase domain-containing protein n=1 Tax=Bartonella tamiae Th239 TaxID=1094558 RepID=J1K3D8_9HYPH|nr:site-specific integrase [Bartonella tamiae]EJF91640.1 hypothetical protein ME5_00019 [Bartonella tamiae Th239]EJF92685.1 hypothetical protein MEG_01855 [Bartonella tamiae Th307]